jgi:hypothetical protein
MLDAAPRSVIAARQHGQERPWQTRAHHPLRSRGPCGAERAMPRRADRERPLQCEAMPLAVATSLAAEGYLVLAM